MIWTPKASDKSVVSCIGKEKSTVNQVLCATMLVYILQTIYHAHSTTGTYVAVYIPLKYLADWTLDPRGEEMGCLDTFAGYRMKNPHDATRNAMSSTETSL